MRQFAAVLTGFCLLSFPVSAAGTQTILGVVTGQQIKACGVTVEIGANASITPFLEAASDLSGRYRLTVTKRSVSGTSMNTQANVFHGGQLGASRVSVDQPATIDVSLSIENADGGELCRLVSTIEGGRTPRL